MRECVCDCATAFRTVIQVQRGGEEGWGTCVGHDVGQELAVRHEVQVFPTEPEAHGCHPPGDVGHALLGVREDGRVPPLIVILHLMHLNGPHLPKVAGVCTRRDMWYGS